MTGAPYEYGMRIIYDPRLRTVTVTFRGRTKTLNGLFTSEESARAAAESYCRCLGWNPKSAAVPVRSLLAHRRAAGLAPWAR